MGRLADRIRRFPRWVALTIGVVVVGGVVTAAVFGYRTWDYIEHDNDFCLSCHLMVEPYEQFAESAHRGLGCKACHKPDLVTRSQMGLTQILENPDSLAVHAEVPNEKCESCHVEGDPDAWRQIAASAGHRVHFESKDTSLTGLQCVGCHSSSVHEFAATDQTCGQSGCHEDTHVRLGKMGDLTIHCVACHEFNRPEAATEVSNPEIRPGGAECLSCHAMRRLVGEMPPDEPHGGACGACHNPHEQSTPAEAVKSCGVAGCHAASETLTPMHRGLPDGVLAQCTLCHAAHNAELERPSCESCHRNPDARAVPPPPPGAAPRPVARTGLRRLFEPPPAAAQQARGARRAAGQDSAAAPGSPPAADDGFTHGSHTSVACTACHSTEDTHGALTVRTAADCRSCHHGAAASADCSGCHPAVRLRGEIRLTRTLPVAIGGGADRPRTLEFDHESHAAQPCGACHADGSTRPATASSCADCHADHHDPAARCAACHVEPPISAHPVDVVHRTCAGSGCHPAETFEDGPPRTRTGCLACHRGLADHEPGRRCGDCHALTAGEHAALDPAAAGRAVALAADHRGEDR